MFGFSFRQEILEGETDGGGGGDFLWCLCFKSRGSREIKEAGGRAGGEEGGWGQRPR